jgi:hypothetical protein
MGSPSPLAALRCSAVILVLAVVVPVASGVAAGTSRSVGTQASAVPPHLVGTWTRTVTRADVKRTGAHGIPVGTVCTLTVKNSSGESRLVCTKNVDPLFGFVVRAGSGRVHINLGLAHPDVYTWRVSGPLLTFTKVEDTVRDRVAAMEGVWRRT